MGKVSEPSEADDTRKDNNDAAPKTDIEHKTAVEATALDGSYQTASSDGISYEVPSEFEEFDPGALEIQLSYMYPDDPKSPSIMIQEPGGGLPSVREPVSLGIMDYSSNGWLTWKGSAIKYYGFKDKTGNEKLLIVTAADSESVNAMMENVLDHAAMTLSC